MFRQWMCIGVLVLMNIPLWTQDAKGALGREEIVSEQRVALVIGNAAYDQSPLRNPVNDANSMAATLKACGFTVHQHTNLNRIEMSKAVLAFSDSVNKRGGVGLFFYSGHAFSWDGENYLIPVNFKVNEDISSENQIKIHGLSMNLVLEMMVDVGNRVNILILDADMAAMNVSSSGMFIAYAASPGQQSLDVSFDFDGTSSNSPFTGALVEVIREPGLRIEEVFRKVRMKVQEDTAGRQQPWTASSLIEDFYFVLPSENDPELDAGQAYEQGQMYYYGYGVKADDAVAEKWFRKAADQGVQDAQIYLRQIKENRVAVGRNAPNFTLQTLTGKRFNLAEQRGRPIFLNFWATWCSPCRDEMPDMQKLQQTLGDSILIVGIDMGESADTVREFVQDSGYTWTFVLDPDGEVSNTYNVSVIPTSLFIDAQGVIVRRFGRRDYETFLEAAREAIGN